MFASLSDEAMVSDGITYFRMPRGTIDWLR